jgi:hypothetical protein
MSWFELLRAARGWRLPAIRAYSEFMPPPYIGLKPSGEVDRSIMAGDDGWVIPEHEEHGEFAPAVPRIAERLFEAHDAGFRWPGVERDALGIRLAFSKTQDDKGRVRWTLFGASHFDGKGPTALPYAAQIPLLRPFARGEGALGLRVAPSGWLDERAPRPGHRWEHVERDAEARDGLDDPVAHLLFSIAPERLGLYGKPMARNAQIWSGDFEPILHGPEATSIEIAAAELKLHAGGRYGYRVFHPPMHAGPFPAFWHRTLTARRAADGAVEAALRDGWIVVERPDVRNAYLFRPVFRARPLCAGAMALFPRDPGLRRLTTSDNVRKLEEWRELLGRPLPRTLALRLLSVSKDATLESWLASLPERSGHPAAAARLARAIEGLVGEDPEPGEPLTLEETRGRGFEERYWGAIAELSRVPRRNNADDPCGLDDVVARLKEHYGRLGIEAVEHRFRVEADYAFPWAGGRARNLIARIPGRDRSEAVLMCDHIDTAYMEDVYREGRRAASPGADDNASGTAALMLGAGPLLRLSRDGRLARDVWLVHLTGEEFPADCLGARALARDLVNGTLKLDGRRVDVRARGVFVLDMIAHNHDRDLYTFQIAPGEGRGSARLAWTAHVAAERWNRRVGGWNEAEGRRGRSARSTAEVPPPAARPAMIGEIRQEWEPRSALYNTDGQIFSDVGLPVVLFMENYDLSRSGYHDTKDTMENIDLDYGAALAAIAIEAVAAEGVEAVQAVEESST